MVKYNKNIFNSKLIDAIDKYELKIVIDGIIEIIEDIYQMENKITTNSSTLCREIKKKV